MSKKRRREGIGVFWETPSGITLWAYNLTEKEASFFRKARRMFLNNCDWTEFENFVSGYRPGWKSPIYSPRQKHYPDPTKNPLYIILREMWLALGIKQGHVAKSKNGKLQSAEPVKRSR